MCAWMPFVICLHNQKIMAGIDAHQHFWNYDAQRDSWITDDMSVIQRDFSPEDLMPLLKAHGFDGCVAVQADQSERETQFLLDLAAKHPWIMGVVGWLDLTSPDLSQRLAYYSQFKALMGLRHIVQAEPDDNFMLREDFQLGISQLSAYNLTYDILVFPKQLPAAIGLVSQFPYQPFVLDHIAKPFIKDQIMGSWDMHIRELAQYPNVCCKLSGMVTEADWTGWTYQDFVPYLEVIWDAFGPERLMVGSDWPVCEVAGGYDKAIGVVTQFLAPFSDTEKEAVWGGNARDFYGL